MAFHDIRFPANLSFGSVGGPERRTEIVTLASGWEERSTPWLHSRRRYDAGMGLRSLDDMAVLLEFFEARAGQVHAFRWKDWSDFKSCAPSRNPAIGDQEIGTGDGARREFALQKRYVSGPSSYIRPIVKPVLGSVRVGVGGVDAEAEIDHARGVVRLAEAPAAGVAVTAGFEFDVPVRFDTDRIVVSVASFQAGEMPAVPVLEVRL